MKIIEVNYGIASRYDDVIEINKHLNDKEWVNLRTKVMKHELSHTNGKYSKKDFIVDFQSKDSYFFESIKFCLKHPFGFINFFMFMYSYHFQQITFNLTSLFPFFYFGLIFSIFWWVVGVPLKLAIINWVIWYFLFNFMLIFTIHFYHQFKR